MSNATIDVSDKKPPFDFTSLLKVRSRAKPFLSFLEYRVVQQSGTPVYNFRKCTPILTIFFTVKTRNLSSLTPALPFIFIYIYELVIPVFTTWRDLTSLSSAETSGAETAARICPGDHTSCRRNGERRNGGAQTAAPKRRRRFVCYSFSDISISGFVGPVVGRRRNNSLSTCHGRFPQVCSWKKHCISL